MSQPSLWIIALLLPTAIFFRGEFSLEPSPMEEERCDNALDDDGDGLIDLNDPDCDCPVAEPVSLIPNPSFEDYDCCPESFSQLSCADTWIQASEATTDYIHTCGWMGWEGLPVPLPIPDGEACIGFRDGRFQVDSDKKRPGWKEYAGACLNAPLRKGLNYRFQFYVGMINFMNSPPINVIFFGTTDCSNLPFGLSESEFGCPTNGPGWVRLGSAYVNATNTWIQTSIDLVPEADIYAIAIGPDCPERQSDTDLYYFFDNLVLDEQSAFEFKVNGSGNPCSNDFRLAVPPYDTLQYQWYFNGVALLGETGSELRVKTGEGRYEAMLIGPSSCQVTSAYYHDIPQVETQVVEAICPGEGFPFGGLTLTEPGQYTDTLRSVEQCDSIVQLRLKLSSDYADTLRTRIFQGESYQIGTYQFDDQGEHIARLQTESGCDSLVYVQLDYYDVFFPNAFSPNGDGYNDYFTVFGNADLTEISSMQVFDRWGGLAFSANNLPANDETAGWDGRVNNREASAGVYLYSMVLKMEDGIERHRSGSLLLIR